MSNYNKHWSRNIKGFYIPPYLSYIHKEETYKIKHDQMMPLGLYESDSQHFTVNRDGKFLLINTHNKTIRSRRGELAVTGSVITIRINLLYLIRLILFIAVIA